MDNQLKLIRMVLRMYAYDKTVSWPIKIAHFIWIQKNTIFPYSIMISRDVNFDAGSIMNFNFYASEIINLLEY